MPIVTMCWGANERPTAVPSSLVEFLRDEAGMDFCENAIIRQFHEGDHQIDIAGETAVVNFGYEMLYERSAEQYRATGRDLWVFEKQGARWLAVWRTMLDLNETAA